MMEGLFTCNLYNESFNSIKELELHYNLNHEKRSKFKCDICGHISQTKFNYNRHLKTHNNYCKPCKEVFVTKADFKSHNRHHHPDDLTCVQCLRKYKSRQSLKLHAAVCGRKRNKKSSTCKHCLKKFSRPHHKDYHEDICPQNPENHEANICHICGSRFQMYKSLVGHINKAHNRLRVEQDVELFPGHRVDNVVDDDQQPCCSRDLETQQPARSADQQQSPSAASRSDTLKPVPWGDAPSPWEGTADEKEMNKVYKKYKQSILRPDDVS